ncbi:Disease resistance protein [Corchorus capsularis]|uniref:Disease resistance protein n=1 Tax=Corchorus capsularis TaxID=210143 RepID=A0A1R3JI01_COCAP|nr:Disease resistance protein [Corchorus capsularis]
MVEPAIVGASLNCLLNTFKELCGNGVGRLNRIEQDVDSIRTGLSRSNAILRDFDAREDEISDESNQTEDIQQLRVASFRAADALEGYSNQLAGEDGGSDFCGVFKSIKNLKSQIEFASEIKHARLSLSTLLDGLERQLAGRSNSNVRELRPCPGTWRSLREDALLLEEDDLVGIEAPREKLITWLLSDDSKLKVISVVGMGGMGKTTLVKKVYDDVSLLNHFTYHVWTTISESFKMDELLRDIIRQIHAESRLPVPHGVETMGSTKLKKMVKDSLRSCSYLLVLDDVWSIEAWIAIQNTLPRGNGNRVVLTTRDANIAPPACQDYDGEIHTMDKLSKEESKRLLCRKAFQDGNCPPLLDQIVDSILKKCDGLPLAIYTIGAFLSTKEVTNAHEWEMVNSSLGFELRVNNQFDFMKKILSLSYSELPESLKSCFLYFSIIPEDYTIEYSRLTRLWMAEEFVLAIEGKTAEEVAEKNFKMLQARNLIQAAETTSDGRVKTCRIHDILHQICILKSKDQRFAAIHKDGDADWPDNVRRLSIHNTLQNVEQIRNNSHIRALFVFGLGGSPSKATMHALLHENHRMVRLLDLQAAPLKLFPREITNLVHLRYLNLRLTMVKAIPSSICKLKNLETLDLKHAHVSKLPASIVELQKLRVLLVYRYDQIESYTQFNYKYGFRPPDNIGKLRSLQKLCFLEANQGRHILTELGNLGQLRRLGVIKLKEKDGKALCSSIKKLSQLRALSVTSENEEEIIDLSDLQPLPDSPLQCLERLQRLYLTGRLTELPRWLPKVTSLVRLTLKGSRLKDAPISELQLLPELVHLELLQVYNGNKLHFQGGGFTKLKVLGLDKFDELESIEVDEGSMPNLEKLIIQRCNRLKKVPLGIQYLTNIKGLELFDMPPELITSLRPGNPGSEDWKTIAHIAQVYSANWKDKGWESQSLGSGLNERENSLNVPISHCWK